jgi:hypothetical protein
MNKKLNETTGLPFIQTSKIVSNYLNIKKLADLKKMIGDNVSQNLKIDNNSINNNNYNKSKKNIEETNCNIINLINLAGAISFSLPCSALMDRNLDV